MGIFKREYYYFVSYLHEKGSGMLEISRKKKIKTFADLLGIVDAIKESNSDFGTVVILNWKRVSK